MTICWISHNLLLSVSKHACKAPSSIAQESKLMVNNFP